MATSSSTLPLGPHDYHTPFDNLINNSTNGINAANMNEQNSGTPDLLRCFICDSEVQGRHYSLASCRTQCSRSRVIEKLGELVGERYMVVISEDDIICRSCANLMNNLDRLETEMKNVREVVLRFLEHKYSLEEGELLDNNESKKPSQPPQITQWKSKNVILDGSKNKKTGTWLQCDKCRYTTQYNTFMIHHIRDHIKQKVFCDKCGVQFPGNQQRSNQHQCSLINDNTTKILKEERELFSQNNNCEAMEVSTVKTSNDALASSVPTQSQISNLNDNVPLLQIAPSSNLQIQNILVPETNIPSGQPIYFKILPNPNTNEPGNESLMIPELDSGTEGILENQRNNNKQVLTLAEDGTLRVVEVAWNDENSATPF